MDKIVTKAWQQCYRHLVRKNVLFRSRLGLMQQKHFSRQTNTSEFLSQLTTIQFSNNFCRNCLSGRLNWSSTPNLKQLPSALQKQIKALACMLMRSSWLRDDINRLFATKEQHINLSDSGDKSSQKPDSKGEKKASSSSNEGKDSEEEGKPEDEEGEKARRKVEFMRSLYTFISVLLLAWLLTPSNKGLSSTVVKYISWSEFYHNILLKGEVKSIHLHFSSVKGGEDLAVIDIFDGAVVKGQIAPQTQYMIKIPKGFNFEEKVRQVEDELNIPLKDRIPISYVYPNSWVMVGMQLFVVLVIFFFIRQIFTSFLKGKDGNMPDMMDIFSGGMRQAKFTRVDIASKGTKAVTFKDVAGLREAKIEVMEFVDYLTNPQRFMSLGAKTPRGALLLGPPGCGKTLLARALATEAKVPFLAMAGSEFVEMIGGVGAARIRSLFKEARNKAPCIIYVDEIDAIGRSRGGSASVGGEDEHTLNQLLVEMDGIGTQEGVIMLAATNRADILDKALLRPGRFDRHIMIDLPTLIEREEIFNVYLSKLKLSQPTSVYAKPLSKLTPGMSGADISNVCNEAAIHAARFQKPLVEREDFEYAVERAIAGTEKRTRLLAPSEKKVVAYHESGHALVGWMLKYTDALLRISIVPRTNSVLGFAQYLPSDQKLYSQDELFERMCMALGGRAAESLIFNHVSTGAHDDLKRVTKMAYDQICSFGMNARIGHLSFPKDEESSGTKPYSQKLAAAIDEEARMLVTRAFLHTQSVLQEHKEKLHKLATTLLEKEVLNYNDIENLIGPPLFGKKGLIEPQGWEGIMPELNAEKVPK
uniref:AAA+ ATPase domain-containing protein n=1 Tax=Arion vulgaris TaxID=1028688 RepID=A0A0B7A7D2_9EUPU